MKPMLALTPHLRIPAILSLIMFAAPAAFAKTITWTGGGSNPAWNQAANWGGASYANGDDAVFGNAPRLDNYVTSGKTIKSITFTADAPSYTIGLSSNNSSAAGTITLQFIPVNTGITIESGNTADHSIGVNLGGAQVGSLVLNGTIPVVHNGSGTLSLTRPVSGAGGITKSGPGILRLTSTNTYSGTTSINAGTLALGASGSIDGSSGVILGGGTFDVSAIAGGYTLGNLSGSGTVAGALNVSTQLSIGASPGTIDFGSLTLASTSSYLFELTGNDSTADLANISGSLTLDGGALDLVQLGTFTVGDKFTLFGYDTGNLTGTFAGLADGGSTSGAGGLWEIDYDDNEAGINGGTGTSFVTITAIIPEPSTALLGALGMLALLRRRRF